MKITSEICTFFIPPEIISHLWNIVDLYEEDYYMFMLSSRRLGDAMIQDIRIDIDGFSFHHTVLGFKPVDFTVKAYQKGGDFIMSLVPSEKAMHQIRKWERVKARLLFRRKKTPEVTPHFRLRKAS